MKDDQMKWHLRRSRKIPVLRAMLDSERKACFKRCSGPPSETVGKPTMHNLPYILCSIRIDKEELHP
jgi:hypothetical protein